MLSVRTSISTISSRLSGEKPLPKPLYYTKMNPQEQVLHNIIGEQKYEYTLDKKGHVHKHFLSYAERQQKQRMFYESRVGHAIVGDEWMRMKLPSRGGK